MTDSAFPITPTEPTTFYCPFPTKEQIPNGRYFYRAPEHTNWKMAPENYPLRFRCSRGFVKKGAVTSVCRDSRWTRSIPKCLAMKCTDPPALLNGSYTLDNGENHPLTIGTKVIYTCDPGYHLHNFADSVTCTLNWDDNDVFWNGTTPGCIFK
ncbi:hypothetical protein AVEN_264087-1 [Araneus ventricosus]|uniref:Sushi domain-containing protein n=1 Tax=Araneus ventricosus TaxID=182803 RepID=A0A4Y2QSR9_ARAVE|nr:hypothetical protein AVEN_199405-1 [Araneus ventricosus]GBN66195.1 hypothetical protein AVEN_264087-1 [Araneus ventricosus]